jgi:sugar (pentulose or hexulose) kinase
MNFLGIDLGASFLKSGLLNLQENKISDVRKIPSPSAIPNQNPQFKEFDANQIYQIILETIEHYEQITEIRGIVFSNQMHGFVLADQNYNNLTNYISWQDERSLELIDDETVFSKLQTLLSNDIVQTGMPFKVGIPVTNLYYLCLKNQIPENTRYFCSLGDYVIMKLTKSPVKTHITNAAGSGMFDLVRSEWHKGIIDKLGLDEAIFPPLTEFNEPVGVYSFKGQDIPCYVSVGDQQAALLGALFESNELSINIGTGSQISVLSDQLTFGEYQTRPFFTGSYLNTITHIPAGRAINVFVKFVEEIALKLGHTDIDSIWPLIMRESSDILDNSLKVDISVFSSSALPQKGFIQNIREDNFSIGHLFHGIFDNMAQNYYDLSKLLPLDRVEHLKLSGGISLKNHILRELLKSKFTLDIELAPYKEDTLIGLFQIALVCSKRTVDLNYSTEYIKKNNLIL